LFGPVTYTEAQSSGTVNEASLSDYSLKLTVVTGVAAVEET